MLKWFRYYIIIIIMCCMTWDTLQCEFIFLSVTRREICADATYSVHVSKVCAAHIRINSHQYHIIYILISYELLKRRSENAPCLKECTVWACVWQRDFDRWTWKIDCYFKRITHLLGIGTSFMLVKSFFCKQSMLKYMFILRVCLIKISSFKRST